MSFESDKTVLTTHCYGDEAQNPGTNPSPYPGPTQPAPQGAPPPPYYGHQFNTGQVITTQTWSGEILVQPASPKPPNFMACSIFTCFMFNPLFGFIAIVLSMSSTESYNRGNIQDARMKGRAALGMSMFGTVLSIALLVILFTVVFSI